MKRARITSWRLAALGAGSVLLLAACGQKAAQPPPLPPRNQITAIDVAPGEGTVNVRITGTEVPDAKLFKLTDPVRLIVDIANSDVSSLSPTITVNNEVIQDITSSVTAAGAISRVIITLKVNAPYETRTEGNSLVVSLTSPAGAMPVAAEEAPADEDPFGEEDTFAAEEAPADEDPFGEEDAFAAEGAMAAEAGKPAEEGFAAEEGFDEFGFEEEPLGESGDEFGFEFEEEPLEAAAAGEATAAAGTAEAPASVAGAAALEEGASKLAVSVTSVLVRGEPGAVELQVNTNGAVAEHDSFTLDNPNRLVVDIPNVTNATGAESVDPGGMEGIVAITISELPDRARIVVEHKIPDFEYTVTKGATGLTAMLRTAGAVAMATAGAAAAVDEFSFDETSTEGAAAAQTNAATQAGEEEFSFEEPAGADEFAFEATEPAASTAAQTATAGQAATTGQAAAGGGTGAGVAAGAVAFDEEEEQAEGSPEEFVFEEEFPEEEPLAPAGKQEAYPVAAPALAGDAKTQVISIDFLPGQETTSVKVSFKGDLQTEVVDSAAQQVTVRVLNATLGQDLVRALDTSRYVGPISMVKSFVEGAGEAERGRVVIDLRRGAKYKLRREAGALYLDFPTKAPAPAVAEAAPKAVVKGAPAAGMPEQVAVSAAELESWDLGEAAGEDLSAESLALGETDVGGGVDISQQYAGRKISLEFREADIRDVLQLIAEVSQLNLIAAEEVRGSISITLKNVPWDQALDIILETNSLGKKVSGNVIRIAPAEKLAAEEEKRLQEEVSREQLEPLAFQIVPVNYAGAGDMQPRIQDILSPRGTVTVDERTNSLLIKDIRRSIDRAIETVRALDTQTGQVLIESRIVTTTLTWARELGIQWGGSFRSDPAIGNNLGNNRFVNNFMVDLPITAIGQRSGSAVGFSFGTLNDAFDIDVVLSAFENSGQSRLVASPRISVLDNKQAEIKTGLSVPITTVQGGTISTTFVDAVLGVKVTPQITSDNSVIMKLEVFDNTINVAIPTAFGNPAINKNEAKTELLVRDGHTVVIGGIVQVQNGFNEIAVPYFNKIPFLGYLFRTREWTDDRQEILIFMTPQIVRN